MGAAIRRNEDPRLLRGLGCFVADVTPAGLLHAAAVRSPHARARLRSIDASRARARRGVHLVLTAAELGALNQPTPLLIPHPELAHPRTPNPLAVEEVRYAGELVAFVVADDRYLAQDAAQLVDVDYEPLPAVVELETAGADGAPRVHPDVRGNRAARVAQRVGDPDAAFARAAHVFRERLAIERSCGSPLETRGVVAEYDARTGMLRAWISTQAPLPIKNGLARMFDLPEFKVEVIAPDVGGGFGTKIMLFYPEEILVPAAAIRLRRAVKWIEDRSEHLTSSSQERGQIHDVEVATDADGRILALRDRFLHDTGAYTPYGIIVPLITATQLPGPYKLRHYDVEFEVRYTNKVMVTPYRGAGRPHGAFVMERMIGRIARELRLEPSEVRRRNFIQPDEFPWDVGLTFQDGGPTRYDSGDYPAGLEMALERIGVAKFRAAQRAARAEGRYLGLGVACYVEGTGIGPYEGAHVRVEPSGSVYVATGLTTQGQGHQTTFAQIAAESLGCDPRDVTVVTGDTSRFNWGAGTFASRALVTAGNAVAVAAGKVRDKALRLAADLLEVATDDLEVRDGAVFVKGLPDRRLALGALAAVANPIRYAYGKEAAEAALRLVKPRQGAVLRDGEEPGLEARGYYAPPHATFASGCHAAVVEVDVETGIVRFIRYVVQHDCGRIVNPTIVEGQIHGGVAQGIGGALYEKLCFDAAGQPLTPSFMQFHIPTAAEVPSIDVVHLETLSPLNPLGVKGVGEAGAIPVPALVAEAVEDALAPFGVRVREMPLSPERIRELILTGDARRVQ
ncbi:MAG TPA: aerobic carbon-monoxide dehydrogenase large subunit [Methylomirabilota bacterium]